MLDFGIKLSFLPQFRVRGFEILPIIFNLKIGLKYFGSKAVVYPLLKKTAEISFPAKFYTLSSVTTTLKDMIPSKIIVDDCKAFDTLLLVK